MRFEFLPGEAWTFLTEHFTDFASYLVQKADTFWTEITQVHSHEKLKIVRANFATLEWSYAHSSRKLSTNRFLACVGDMRFRCGRSEARQNLVQSDHHSRTPKLVSAPIFGPQNRELKSRKSYGCSLKSERIVRRVSLSGKFGDNFGRMPPRPEEENFIRRRAKSVTQAEEIQQIEAKVRHSQPDKP
ncbi:unnamed protein product [Bemisia tabaci]|uniref:Uncharacterized protein n=1 Tax=Bemisia tabaci TaxID=7038 RepID=A0AAI8UVF3_BEMTA|nr:unnamed protein product [Bemisia tabaci]